ncbi:BLUF domain-containing protein [Novosphingobium sp. Gsoil 351]|uniref:BLUF domain-containing protein n=1 Tax=Novosphingobium sp. Gsoil 351 TaxID=2675225 RepID=UPI0018A847A5|nr:BLUF domain-containing protein [Novosphingobium sp. Gsoil 351]
MSIYNLVYSSCAQLNPDNAVDLAMIDDILAIARQRNAAVDVTGALLFTEGKFVQALEGDRTAVRATYARIAADPRHDNVEILSSQFSDRRRFKQWSMAFVGDNEALRDRFGDSPLAALGKKPAGDALLDFMLELARSSDETLAAS